MSKVKPVPFNTVVPPGPILHDEEEPKDDQDEQDDEPEDQDEAQAQALGMLRAVEDLTVLDFFAGMIATSMASTMASKDVTETDRATVAERVYKFAQALARTRARIEGETFE